MENKTGYNLELIEWLDAYEHPNGWKHEDEVDGAEFFVTSVGWVVHEDDTKIVTVSRIAQWSDNGDRMLSDVFTIPKPWIKNRYVIEHTEKKFDVHYSMDLDVGEAKAHTIVWAVDTRRALDKVTAIHDDISIIKCMEVDDD